MLEQFAKEGRNDTFEGTWNAVSGVTEGAFNAYLISLHENENSTAAVHDTVKSLKDFWIKVGSDSVTSRTRLASSRVSSSVTVSTRLIQLRS